MVVYARERKWTERLTIKCVLMASLKLRAVGQVKSLVSQFCHQ